MNRRGLIALMRTSAIVVMAFLVAPEAVPAQKDSAAQKDSKDPKGGKNAKVGQTPTPYNPYPPGILPADLESELDRVQREIGFIFQQALAEFRALPPPNLTGLPPILQGSGYDMVRTLGKLMNYDVNMSTMKNVACASCHMPYAGFGPPIPSVNLTMIAYPGSFHFRAGKRNPQRYSYSPYFPVLTLNETQGLFFGGNFWDSRATGYLLQSPDAHQSQGPPVDTQEMMSPDTACIAFKLSQAEYRPLFEQVWGQDSLNIKFPPKTEEICATPGGAKVFGTDTTPVKLKPEDRLLANRVYDNWGQSISFYESSPAVSAFSSKVDAAFAGLYNLTPDEIAGRDVLRGKAELDLDAARAADGRPTAGVYDAQCGHDTAAVSHHRSARALLSKGVLSQWLREEPEATRPFLQHARPVCVQRHIGKLPAGKNGKGGLLADARGREQHRHDDR